jgi:hypothetical protein
MLVHVSRGGGCHPSFPAAILDFKLLIVLVPFLSSLLHEPVQGTEAYVLRRINNVSCSCHVQVLHKVLGLIAALLVGRESAHFLDIETFREDKQLAS